MLLRASFLWRLVSIGSAVHLTDVGRLNDVDNSPFEPSFEPEGANQGSGLVGNFGKKGFRMLGGSCWDSDVWEQDFHLTRAMCAKTRSHRSWSRMSEKVIKKLHEGQCISVVTLGASQTFGMCGKCYKERLPDRHKRGWPGQFRNWINSKFPCDGAEGHQVHNLAVRASDAGFWAMQAHVWKADESHVLNTADLVLVDTAVTDAQCHLGVLPTLRMPILQGMRSISESTEILIRLLKALPNSPWIVFTELTWMFNPKMIEGDSHWDATLTHLPVIKHYDVDQVSLLDAMLPLHPFRNRWLNSFFLIDGGHGTPFGHQVIAQIIAHTLMEESHFLNLPPAENEILSANGTNDSMPEVLWADKELAALYDQIPPKVLFPDEEPFRHTFKRTNFVTQLDGWGLTQVVATNETVGEDGVAELPTLNLWVNLTWSGTRLFDSGYVNLGLRRATEHGGCTVRYHVMREACGEVPTATNYTLGLDINPWWPVPLDYQLRYSEGFWFALPPTTEACMVMEVQFKPAEGADPAAFILDDLTVLA